MKIIYMHAIKFGLFSPSNPNLHLTDVNCALYQPEKSRAQWWVESPQHIYILLALAQTLFLV